MAGGGLPVFVGMEMNWTDYFRWAVGLHNHVDIDWCRLGCLESDLEKI